MKPNPKTPRPLGQTQTAPQGADSAFLPLRRTPRVQQSPDLQIRAFFSDGQFAEGEGTVLDISKGGCRISCPSDLTPGMAIELWVFLPNYEWPLRIQEAVVRWTEPDQFGVEFLSLRPAQRERLRHFLQLSSRALDADPSWQ